MEVVANLTTCLPPANQAALLKTAFPVVMNQLEQEIKYQREEEIINAIECLTNMLTPYKQKDLPFPSQSALSLLLLIKQALTHASQKKKSVVKKYNINTLNQLDADDEELTEFKDEYESVNDLFQCNMELGG
jgi:hypothetical protein